MSHLALPPFARVRSGELPEDNSSSVGVSMLSGTIGSFPLLRVIGCLAWLVSCTSFPPRSCLFLPGPTNYRFHVADVQRDPTILSSVSPVPSVSFP